MQMVQVLLSAHRFFFFVLICFVLFFRFFFLNHIFPFGLFFFREVFAISVFLVMFIGFFFHCACIVYRDIKHLESYESTQIKSPDDHLSPEIPHESSTNFGVPAQVCDVVN